jgi:hypothetical protein
MWRKPLCELELDLRHFCPERFPPQARLKAGNEDITVVECGDSEDSVRATEGLKAAELAD